MTKIKWPRLALARGRLSRGLQLVERLQRLARTEFVRGDLVEERRQKIRLGDRRAHRRK
jgi:hypothetical protein